MAERRHRSFAAKSVKKVRPEDRLTFDLGSETFHGVVAIPGTVVIDAMETAQENPTKFILDFIRKAVDPEEHERLDATLKSETEIIEMDELSGLVKWLMEEYATGPTDESSS